jgi:anti-sigma-K factor RskA
MCRERDFAARDSATRALLWNRLAGDCPRVIVAVIAVIAVVIVVCDRDADEGTRELR